MSKVVCGLRDVIYVRKCTTLNCPVSDRKLGEGLGTRLTNNLKTSLVMQYRVVNHMRTDKSWGAIWQAVWQLAYYPPCHRSSLCAAVHYAYVYTPVVLATFSPSLQLHWNWLLSCGIWECMVHLSYTLANIQHSNIQPIPPTSFKKFMDFY